MIVSNENIFVQLKYTRISTTKLISYLVSLALVISKLAKLHGKFYTSKLGEWKRGIFRLEYVRLMKRLVGRSV